MYKKIISMLLTLTLILGMFSSALPVFAEGEDATASVSYEKVSKLEAGKTYVIVAEGMAMTTTPHTGYVNSNKNAYSGFTGTAVTDGTIANVVTDNMLWSVETSGNGFAFKNVSNEQYLCAFYEKLSSGSNNGIEFSNSAQTWTLGNDSKLKNVDTEKYLAWDKISDISPATNYTGSAELFTIRSSSNADTITFYVVTTGTGEDSGENPDTPVTPDPTPGVVNGTFTKVTGLEDGKTYVIESNGKGMNATTHDGYHNSTGYDYSGFAGTAVTVSGDKITSDVTEDMLWIAETSGNGFAFKNASNNQYLIAAYSGSGNSKGGYIAFGDSAQTWTYNGTTLKHDATSASSGSDKFLTWDEYNDISGNKDQATGSADLFTIRSKGDTITFYLAEIVEDGGETCQHEWADATCTAPKTCTLCEATDGNALGHTMSAATCTAPATCSVCGETEGEANGHTLSDATCTAPATCSVCGATEGEANGHAMADATCTVPATCLVCGETEGEANGHSMSDATCTTPATCSVCGATEGEVVGEHAYNDGEVTTAPTCTEDGVKTFTCTVCGDTYTEVIEAEHLNVVVVNGTPATCTEDGLTDGRYCSACDTVTAMQETIDALDHDFEKEWTVDKEATCSEEGSESRHCSRCDETTDARPIEKIDHSFAETWTVDKEADCTTAGSESRHCSECDETTDEREIPALGHKWPCVGDMVCVRCNESGEGETTGHKYNGTVKTPATCIATGVMTYVCEKCDDTYEEPIKIDPENHVGETVVRDKKDATCGDAGYTGDTYCLDCNEISVPGEEIPATGKHDYADATCIAPQTCKNCPATTGDPLPHTEEPVPGYKATCSEPGLTDGMKCTECGTVTLEQKEIPATGEHSFDELVEDVASTCSTLGHITMKCTCGKTETTYSEEYDENNHEDVRDIKASDPTCTEPGSEAGSYCMACGDIIIIPKEIPALGHDHKNYVSNNDATCTKNGTETAICERCGEPDTREDDESALDHDWADATCTEPMKCKREKCDETKGEKLGHSFTNYVPDGDATCTKDGHKTATCDNGCNSTLTIDDIGSAGHDIVIDKAVAPTCTETGLSEGQHCSRCDDATVEQTEVAALGHDWNDAIEGTRTCKACDAIEWGDLKIVITADADTVEIGEEITFKVALSPVQSITSIQFTLEIPEGLTFVSGALVDALEETLGATCTFTDESKKVSITDIENAYTSTEMTEILTFTCKANVGFTGGLNANIAETYFANGEETLTVNVKTQAVEVTCTHENYTENENYIEKVAEEYRASAATCTAKAVYYKSCKFCYAVGTDTFEDGEALGHNIVNVTGTPATCTETGLTDGSYCSRCKDETVTVTQTDIPALGHAHSTEWTVDTAATCETAGSKSHHCSRCDDKADVTVIPATGHTDATREENRVEPDCTNTGSYDLVTYCSVCKKELSRVPTSISALGHAEVVDAEVAPSCMTTGLAAGKHCSRCNTVLVAQTTIDALGHDWQQIAPVLPECCARCGISKDATVQVIITADKTTAAVGETITYTVSLGPVYMLDAVEFKLDIPEGLKFQSGALVDGLAKKLNAAACNFNADKLKVAIAGCVDLKVLEEQQQLVVYTSVENTPILTFTCVVEKGTVGDIVMGVDTENWYFADFFQPINAVLDNEGAKVNVPCTHTATTVHEAVASSCTTPGHGEYETCNTCGIVIVEGSDAPLDLDPDNHVDVTVTPAVSGTCLVPGHAEYTECNECGALVSGSKDEVIDPHGNSKVVGDAYIKTAATCTAVAVYYMSCEHCKEANTTATFTSGSALGHDMVAATGTPATCTDAGLTDGTKCSRCDETTQTVIPATGHTWADATCTAAKTCVNCGLTDGESLGHTWTDATCSAPKTCSACKATEGEALPHTWVEATCDTAKTCSVCNTTDGEALGHDLTVFEGKEATCTTDGLTAGEKCSRCDYEVAQTVIPAAGHTWTAATCTAAKTCSVCQATEGTALGHDMVKDEAVDPTCTTVGYTEGAHCSRCDEKVAQQVIDAIGHNITKTAGYAATCTTTGLTDGEKCSRCDYEKAQEEIAALGHEITTTPGYAATCSNTGLTDGEKCSRCDYEKAQNIIPALGHEIVTEGAVAPTCTETGLTGKSYCSRCNEVLTEQTVVAALGHDMVKDYAVEATCTQSGLTEGAHCSRCDEKVEQQVIDARGHNFAAATCTEAKTCIACGVTEGEALGHKATEATCTEASVCTVCEAVISEANGHRFADATCTSPETCTVCGATQNEALGHNWIEASYDAPKTCDRCGAVEGDVLPTYKVSGTITSFGSATEEITVVLKDSEGTVVHTVTTIGNNATFFISDVKSGTYTMVVSKNGHTAREYTVVVADADATQNAAIALTGDLNFDGKVNVLDINMMYDHVLETAFITDEYALQCADIDGDGKIDVSDTNLLYNKVLGE